MSTNYSPKDIEQKWYQSWEQSGDFKPKNDHQGQAFSILLPPPNVTGSLHMGHGFQTTLMDALIRFHRMDGDCCHWQSGTDHAGIATQMLVERKMQAETGQSRHDIGRQAFIDKTWEWKQHSGDQILKQLRRLGASPDWEAHCFTMDPSVQKSVQKTFKQLYDEGLIYRGLRLVNWDPILQTAVSDLEVESVEQKGHLWYFKYPIAAQDQHLIIATTRPETMLGDTAVAVHPDDERYQSLIGESIRLPISERLIPIIADDRVDPNFGSGCVKITPAHDFNDHAIGKDHNLPMITILSADNCLNDQVPESWQGLSLLEARERVITTMDELGLLNKISDHTHQVPKGDRSGATIEPRLTKQWFMHMQPLADAALEALDRGEPRFVPQAWEKNYRLWLENIQDWCLSRQLWWGHRIPAWYDNDENVYIGESAKEIINREGLNPDTQLTQDPDVLDTWYSSSLWPFAALGWPEKTPNLEAFFPSSVLVTGFDIIFFWVARMSMMSLKIMGKTPFKDVYITPLVRDQFGQKMSKSKGNVLDPLDLIDGIDLESLIAKRCQNLMQPQMRAKVEKKTRTAYPDGIPAFGTDALRFSFCALAVTGRDVNFDLNRVTGYRNFCNKLWNAARFVLMHAEGQQLNNTEPKLLLNRWIKHEIQLCIKQTRHCFANYRFDHLAQTLYECIWNKFCDWYIEGAKCYLVATDVDARDKAETLSTMINSLETLLRLAHPIIPFITEEIWQSLIPIAGYKVARIGQRPYPTVDNDGIQTDVAKHMLWLQDIISGIRQLRSDLQIIPKASLTLYVRGDKQTLALLMKDLDFIQRLTNTHELSELSTDPDFPAAKTIVKDLSLYLAMSPEHMEREIKRLNREMEKIQKQLTVSEKKLSNPNYCAKAPETVVSEERQKVENWKHSLDQLQQHRQQLEVFS